MIEPKFIDENKVPIVRIQTPFLDLIQSIPQGKALYVKVETKNKIARFRQGLEYYQKNRGMFKEFAVRALQQSDGTYDIYVFRKNTVTLGEGKEK